MSTVHKNAEINTRDYQKPKIILNYNATKGGVDILNKVTGSYSTKRMIFYNMTDVSAYNAFVIWTEIFPEWNSSKLYKRCVFLERQESRLHLLHQCVRLLLVEKGREKGARSASHLMMSRQA